MTDWYKGKQIDYEVREVDPSTWRDGPQLMAAKDMEITRDDATSYREGIRLSVRDWSGPERYVRVYFLPTQHGETERVCLGTFLVSRPRTSYNANRAFELSGYSPLMELSRGLLPRGYNAPAGSDAIAFAEGACRRWCRAPVLRGTATHELAGVYAANDHDDPLSFVRGLLAMAGMEPVVDPYGRIVFSPLRAAEALQPTWTFGDSSDGSILFPDVAEEYAWFDVPNAVEIVFEGDGATIVGRADNYGAYSPVSRVTRGYEAGLRETASRPAVSQAAADAAAMRRLRELSSAERSISYRHGYCPVRLGDCIQMDYRRFALRARLLVRRQVISCTSSSCTVDETGTWTERLFGYDEQG
jgi:hypothetical protein